MAISTVPVPTIDATGFHMPAFSDVLTAHQSDYLGVYGSDTILTSDSQDGEWTAIEAQALYDTFALALAVYNSFSPATAQGTGLSSVVKVNGIAREVASFSTVDLVNIGQFGRTVTGGQVRDPDSNLWSLPDFTFPSSGAVTVTATCQTLGAVLAPASTVWTIANPTIGWQQVTNTAPASVGAPVELDAPLRIRQSRSTMLPSQNILDGILGAVAAVVGVTKYAGYENDTNSTDSDGVPGHSFSLVVEGGDAAAIAGIIAAKKTPGVGTYGTTVENVTSAQGVTRQICFFRPARPPITVGVTLKSYIGFTLDTQNKIAQAVSDYVNNLGIGAQPSQKISVTRLYGPALLIGSASATTFEISGITLARDGLTLGSSDVAVAFNEDPFCEPSNVTFQVTTG